MISLTSLSAFSANGAMAPLVRPQNAATAASGVQQARAQSASPTPPAPGSAQTVPLPTDKKLPRGSLLNLQV